MADVITRFKLETSQYDSKLRDSAKSLSAFSKQAELAGKDFNKFTQGSVEAARALGQVESGANNTKDKLKDLVGAYNDVARAYNKLTEEQRQSDFAKAMAQSLEELQGRIKETKNELYSLNGNNSGGGLFSGLGDRMSGALSVFGGNLMTKGFELATNAAQNFISTLKEAADQGIQMAKSGEGIRLAYDRLNRPDLLSKLREATHGTINDIELMKAAVKFNDFKLPLSELGTMLEFAQKKAKDTGQSVDYMADSIVTGLGRKSVMILDNLGLSAAEIKERMKETGDMTKAVGEIIREQMSKAGDYVETASDRATRAQVDLQNAMEELGRTLLPLQEESASLWNQMEINALKFLNNALQPIVPGLVEVKKEIGELYDKAVNNPWTNGFLDWLETGLDISTRFLPVISKIRNIVAALSKGGGDMGASVGGSIQGLIDNLPDETITSIDEIIIEGQKSKTKTKSQKQNPTYAEGSIAAQSALVTDLNKKFNESGEAVRNSLLPQLVLAEQKLKTMRDEAALLKANAEGKLLGGNVDTTGLSRAGVTGTDLRTPALVQGISSDALESAKAWQKAGNDSAEAWKNAASAVSMVGNALSGIEDPAARVMGTIAQAIANIALAYAEALAKDKTNKSNIWYFIGTAAVMMASMVSTISQIHQATGYAEGGLVKGGGRYSGDNIPIMANEGELVLTKAMQGNLASQLNNNGGFTGNFDALVSGENIHIVHNRYLKRSGQGEIVTWKE